VGVAETEDGSGKFASPPEKSSAEAAERGALVGVAETEDGSA